MHHIYTITEKSTSKVIYVGVTTQPTQRWGHHCKLCNKKRPITQKILDDGRSNFEFKVILQVEDKLAATTIENSLINNLNTLFPNGYNLRSDVDSERTKAIKSQSQKGIIWTDERRAKHKIVMQITNSRRAAKNKALREGK